jgi:DNA phosphorothioation-dependent restriction protein DptG
MIEKQNKKLGEILLEYGMLSPKNLKKALKVQKEKNKRIGQILMELSLVTQDQVNWVLCKQLDIPYIQIEIEQLDLELLKNFPEYLIKNYRLVPLIEMNNTLVIAMADPTDEEAIQRVKSSTKRNIDIVFASFQNITEIIHHIEKEFPDIW